MDLNNSGRRPFSGHQNIKTTTALTCRFLIGWFHLNLFNEVKYSSDHPFQKCWIWLWQRSQRFNRNTGRPEEDDAHIGCSMPMSEDFDAVFVWCIHRNKWPAVQTCRADIVDSWSVSSLPWCDRDGSLYSLLPPHKVHQNGATFSRHSMPRLQHTSVIAFLLR